MQKERQGLGSEDCDEYEYFGIGVFMWELFDVNSTIAKVLAVFMNMSEF